MDSGKKMQSFWPWQPLLLATVFVFGIIIGGTLDIHSPESVEGTESANKNWIRTKSDHYKLVEALRYIDAQYIEKVDTEELMDVALNAVFDSLDPHSFYITQQEFKDINERTRGDFEGIGVEYVRIEDTIVVVRVVEDGPAKKVGLGSGDIILKANGVPLTSIKNTDSIQKLIKGPSGSEVELDVLHPLGSGVETYTVKRSKIPYHSVKYSGMIDSTMAYIKLSHFNGNAYKEFMQGIESLATNYKIDRLIIDVRDNPGGYLSEVVKILSQLFADGNKLLVYTENRDGIQKEYNSTGKTFYSIGKIAVLVNSNSASASEILAGALQDWERGVVFGQRTYGKGLVQEQFNLTDGSAIRLTTAKYLTPSGRMIQRPYGDGDYANNYAQRLDNGEFYSMDSIERLDSTSFKTQYGSPLLSGEGIIPDEFIPIDSMVFSDCYLWSSTWYQKFVYKYIYRDNLGNTQLDISDMLSQWALYLKKQKGYREHCGRIGRYKQRFKQSLIYYYYLYLGDLEKAFSESLKHDKSIQFVKDYWKKPQIDNPALDD
jgi:carboxyl-terminal processing protease